MCVNVFAHERTRYQYDIMSVYRKTSKGIRTEERKLQNFISRPYSANWLAGWLAGWLRVNFHGKLSSFALLAMLLPLLLCCSCMINV